MSTVAQHSHRISVVKRVGILALVIVLAGCTGLVSDSGTEYYGGPDNTSIHADITVDDEDELTEEELGDLVNRSMARIEYIRDQSFKEPVGVEVISREEFDATTSSAATDENWENLRWQALFVIGHDRDATEVLSDALDEGVQGYYSPANNEIVIVSDSETAAVDKHTLIHELVHALQDQQLTLSSNATTHDERLAFESVIEGEAELLPELYLNRCEIEWSCIQPDGDAGASAEIETGVQLMLLKPYERGPAFVDEIRDQGGWDAVDNLYDQPPESSTQIIRSDFYPEQSPTEVGIADESTGNWSPMEGPYPETLGEAAIFSMFAHNDLFTTTDPFSYTHQYSDGWAGDAFVPYEYDGESAANVERGYIWEIEWQSEGDATEFVSAYERLLDDEGALERGEETVTVPNGPFAGWYQVTQDGTTVTIVHGPNVSSLEEIHTGS